MSEHKRIPLNLNSVTPTESTQELRVEEAARAVGGVKKLESAGFFELAGIDPEVQRRAAPVDYQILAEMGLKRIEELRRKLGEFSGKIPFLRGFQPEDC